MGRCSIRGRWVKEAKVSAAELAEMAREEVLLHGGDEEDLVAHVTSTYSIPPHTPGKAS